MEKKDIIVLSAYSNLLLKLFPHTSLFYTSGMPLFRLLLLSLDQNFAFPFLNACGNFTLTL